jgi:hypothetical protein
VALSRSAWPIYVFIFYFENRLKLKAVTLVKNTIKGTVSRDFGIFEWIYRGRASLRDPPLAFLKIFMFCFH